MLENNLMDESMEFAIAIILSLDSVVGRSVLKNQLIRCATSVGANIREAQYASSRADFISKLQIALKESNESEYWLELMERTNTLSAEKAGELLKKCRHIRYMLVRSVNTAKANGRD